MSNIKSLERKLYEISSSSMDWSGDVIGKCSTKPVSTQGWKIFGEREPCLHPEQCVKVLILGSREVGKSTLLWTFFDFNDGPTASNTTRYANCEVHEHTVEENGVNIRVHFYDTTGAENIFELDAEVCRDVHVVIFCYAVHDTVSMFHLLTRWIPMSRVFVGNVPSILVGNFIDIREEDENSENGNKYISTEEGMYIQYVWRINRFFECSIEDGYTPEDIIHTAVRLALNIDI